MNYLDCFNKSWKKYKTLAPRDHATLNKKISRGWFTNLRHRNRSLETHPARELKQALDTYITAGSDDIKLRTLIVKYLIANPPDNNHSYSSYLIDELMREDPAGGWEIFEVAPVITISANTVPLYRGVKYNPATAFSEGLKQHYNVDSLDDYASSQNGGVGHSTSLNYNVAFDYAAPMTSNERETQNAQIHCKQLFGSSYVYVIHSRSHKLIHIPNTHLARKNYLQYALCFHESEINIAEDIPKSDLYCAIEIKRSSRTITKIHYNPNYVRDENSERIIHLYEKNQMSPIKIENNYNFGPEFYTSMTKENALVKLHKLSQLFMEIKFKSELDSTVIDKKLLEIRNNAFKAFMKCIKTINNIIERNQLIEFAIELKIFSEHRRYSPMNSFFNTGVQRALTTKLITEKKPYREKHYRRMT